MPDGYNSKTISTSHGLLAISPLLVFLLFYLGLSLILNDFYKVPIAVAFLVASIYGVAITTHLPMIDRVRTFGRGAGSSKMMLIVWIFLLAGAFANSAKAMGCIDATVDVTLLVLPPRFILAGLFVSSCFVSMATGTAIGTVIALGPLGVGLANATDANIALTVSSIIGGAFFGDNLSFISDTTIVATSTMGVKMADKFKTNLWIVLPAAIGILTLYCFLGREFGVSDMPDNVEWIKILPYLAVIVLALCGIDVMLVLVIGLLLSGIVGLATDSLDFFGWLAAINEGMLGMGELIIIVLLAGGLMALIKENGGLDWILQLMMKGIHGKRGAQLGIAALTVFVNICTANNTIAIITIGGVAKEISERYGLDPRKVASILDTSSCATQGLLPYGAHLLMGATMAGVSSLTLLPYLYYPMAIALCTVLSILFNYPRKYNQRRSSMTRKK